MAKPIERALFHSWETGRDSSTAQFAGAITRELAIPVEI